MLFGIPMGNLYRLQHIQNSAARIISCAHKRDHITFILHPWTSLATSFISYTVWNLLLTSCARKNGSPSYIFSLIEPYAPSRQLCLTNCYLLACPKVLRKSYGERGFSHSAPLLWNNLPLYSIKQSNSITIFKKRPKTYLFLQYYD